MNSYFELKERYGDDPEGFLRNDLASPSPIRDAEKIKVMETKVGNIIDGLSQACAQTH